MIRSTYALVLLVCGGLVLSACGKKNDNADSTAASGSASASASAAPPATATATAAPADTGSAAPSASASAPPADTAAPVANNQVAQRPIDDCCIALAATALSRRKGSKRKTDAFRAAEICPGIAALVRQGRATRSQALTQIKSAMAGEHTPPQCQ